MTMTRPEELISLADVIAKHGVADALFIIWSSGFTGQAAIDALRRAGVDDVDLEHAALTIVGR